MALGSRVFPFQNTVKNSPKMACQPSAVSVTGTDWRISPDCRELLFFQHPVTPTDLTRDVGIHRECRIRSTWGDLGGGEGLPRSHALLVLLLGGFF